MDRAAEGLLDDLHWKMVMGDEPGEFWGEVYDFIWHHLIEEDRANLRRVYVDKSGFAARFPNLIVVHELAHVYQDFYGGSGILQALARIDDEALRFVLAWPDTE